MNKYQKALDILDMSFDYKEVKEARILLKKLIDKKTPKKPIFEDLDHYLACPRCWNNLSDLSSIITDDLIQPEYCPRCGQHIDWRENDE